MKVFYQIKRTSLLIVACFICILASSTNYYDRPIVGNPTASATKAKYWARQKGAAEIAIYLVDIYWDKSIQLGINPVIAYCQFIKETGYGKFNGIVDKASNNPCGIKKKNRTGDHPDDHARFDSWEDGISAHLDHLALYIGLEGYPKKYTLDPRHDTWLLGIGPTVFKMAKYWSVSPTYGKELMDLIVELEEWGY